MVKTFAFYSGRTHGNANKGWNKVETTLAKSTVPREMIWLLPGCSVGSGLSLEPMCDYKCQSFIMGTRWADDGRQYRAGLYFAMDIRLLTSKCEFKYVIPPGKIQILNIFSCFCDLLPDLCGQLCWCCCDIGLFKNNLIEWTDRLESCFLLNLSEQNYFI